MNAIELKLNDQKRGAFVIEENGERFAEMVIAIIGERLVVYHTEVSEKLRGEGIAAKLLEQMIGYARSNHLKVVPLCQYVHAQFKRHPELYNDIWDQNWKNG
ncbi:GNAT family N-acetyltransferase [Chryseolinea sp. T2]|uniref:GNAT family N-acetyltransferase n=1 Tax=Chryseolinea sp. T2 TaxID=3129255 RepID=UPI003078A5BC